MRVLKLARQYGVRQGVAMNLITGWDFRRAEDRQRAWKHVKDEKLWILIGSLPHTPFSVLQNLNWGKSEARDRLMRQHYDEGLGFLQFVVDLYIHQISQGRYFLREHHWTAT